METEFIESVERRTPRTLGENLLYKSDRTLAIAGIIIIAVAALVLYAGAGSVKAELIATGAISGLVGYIGGRTGK